MKCGRRKRALSSVALFVFAAGVFASDTLFAQTSDSSKATKAPVRIMVAGRLLGYFRVPDRQTDQMTRCPTDWKDAPDARAFRETLDTGRGGAETSIVIGMGENFSPEFFSRLMGNSSPKPGESTWLGKDRFSWDSKTQAWVRNWDDLSHKAQKDISAGKGYIPADNVACFFSGAGFDVLVPGKHDFYFGAERVRMIARLLATPELGYPDPADRKGPVQMLAANLVIRTSFRDQGTPLPDAAKKHLPFVPINARLQPKNLKDNDTLLPYARKFQFVAKEEIEGLQAFLRSNNTGEPDKLTTDDYKLCVTQKPDSRTGSIIVEASLPRGKVLNAGSNYGVCFTGPGVTSNGLPYCVRFATDAPFFQFPNAIRIERTDKPEQPYSDPRPFVVKEAGDRSVAVFGVVDPKLREHVGELNAMWANADRRNLRTEIALVDPVRALRQLLEDFDYRYAEQHCGALNDANAYDECVGREGTFTGVKVLMAQMRSSEARELGAKMEGVFHVLISQPEIERATPNQTVSLDPPAATDKRPTFLLVPRPAYDPARDRTSVQVRMVDRFPDPDGGVKYTVAGTPKPTSAVLNNLCEQGWFQEKVADAWNALAARAVPPDTFPWPIARADCEITYHHVALYAIRQHANADVALLQKRDFFFSAPDDQRSAALADTINRILWKGDFLLKLMVTGSTLKSVFERGAAFDTQDQESLSLQVEKGRGLVWLGMYFDRERKEYLINGAPLDEGRLYTVATSDYIALGDTGYPELAVPVVGRSPLPQDFKILYLISDVLTNAMNAKMNPKTPPNIILAEGYLDDSLDNPPNGTNGQTRAYRVRQWWRPDSNASTFTKMPAPERLVQDQRGGFVSLQKALVSFSDVHNNVSEHDRGDAFFGVSLDQVNAKSSTAASAAVQARSGVIGRDIEWFLSGDLAYSKTSTARSLLPRLENYLDDRLILEPGAFRRVHGKPYPHFGPQMSVRTETQFRRPLQNFDLGTADKATIGLRHERSISILPRLGFRFENRKSSFNVGYEAAIVPRTVRYDFSGDAGPFTCQVEATNAKAVANCVKEHSGLAASASALSITQTHVFRNAMFADARIVVPGSRVSFVSQLAGELIGSGLGDNSTMTHWRYEWSAALTFKILQNLSAQPEVDYFRFRNQLGDIEFQQRKILFGLNYTFDWFSGNFGRALQRPKPAAQASK
jgi:5'-nucleotidase, C-terminal domain